jgi:hypothetical protein
VPTVFNILQSPTPVLNLCHMPLKGFPEYSCMKFNFTTLRGAHSQCLHVIISKQMATIYNFSCLSYCSKK